MQPQQIILLLSVTSALALIALFATWIQGRTEKNKFFIYRARYLQLVEGLHAAATVAMQLSSFLKEVSSKEVLDVFETALTSLKETLVAVREIPPYGKNFLHLEEAFKISQLNYKDFLRVQNLFRSDLTGQLLTFKEFKDFNGKTSLDGCFFCSKPTLDFNFVEVKIKIEGSIKAVKSCVFCNRALKSTGRASILYFESEGKLLHWKDLPSYRPLENFWELNRFKPQTKSRHLELV